MKEPAVTLIYDAKNVIGVLEPAKMPDPDDKDAPKLKRMAPRRPKQQPDDAPRITPDDE